MPPRRVSLPGADELFRTTGGMALSPSLANRSAAEPADAGERQSEAAQADTPSGPGEPPAAGAATPAPGTAAGAPRLPRVPAGRAADPAAAVPPRTGAPAPGAEA
ncbi:hypothetical protein ACFW1A_18940, partial [Kitasatospora sp. NPDC058965]